MNTIRNYKNCVSLTFDKSGDNLTLKVPHYKKWLAIIGFLRKRGFVIGENPTYKEHYDCLSKYHKIGFKKNVACLMEISSRQISVEFGHVKNLWTAMQQSFWNDPSDDRYAKLTYLEGLSVKLEIKRLVDYCKKYNHTAYKEDSCLSPEEYIINKLKVNSHIHGVVNYLNDIKLSIKEGSYDYLHNSNDKNGIKIVCGETKYYYDWRTNRLSCGTVWHNINNMWWVISGGNLTNIASYQLFNFDYSLPRRKRLNNNELKGVLKTMELKQDYYRCLNIKKLLTV